MCFSPKVGVCRFGSTLVDQARCWSCRRNARQKPTRPWRCEVARPCDLRLMVGLAIERYRVRVMRHRETNRRGDQAKRCFYIERLAVWMWRHIASRDAVPTMSASAVAVAWVSPHCAKLVESTQKSLSACVESACSPWGIRYLVQIRSADWTWSA